VVNKQGRLASGYPGDSSGHKQVLEAEGVAVSEDYPLAVRGADLVATQSVALLSARDGVEQSIGRCAVAQFNGEIICADSWTVRREVNIGRHLSQRTAGDQAWCRICSTSSGRAKELHSGRFKNLANQVIGTFANRGKNCQLWSAALVLYT